MKVSDLKKLINEIAMDEVKKTIIRESNEGKKEVYHVTCEGEPIVTCDTHEEATEHVDKLKKDHPGKQFIIEKAVYESHEHMIHELDKMGEELEETENMENTQMQPEEGNMFTGKLKNAKESGKDSFEVGGKKYQVEEEEECDECWGSDMKEEETEDDGYEYMPIDLGHEGDMDEEEEEECYECGDASMSMMAEEGEHEMCECGGTIMEDGCCSECGTPYQTMEESVCEKCGKEVCECGMYESKKKIRVTESELIEMIKDMVNESMKGDPGTPGIPGMTITKRALQGSKKENDDHIKDVEKKIKDYLSFEGNDNPEFPHQIGKGEKVARVNTKDQDDEVSKNFAGLQNLDYDIEPDEKFKERQKKAIEGHSSMGNAPVAEKPSIKPSNGADKGEEPENKEGNVIKTPETAKKINKQVKDREKDKKERVLYPKEKVPMKNVNESKVSFNNILTEEINKIKKLSSYNEKTQ